MCSLRRDDARRVGRGTLSQCLRPQKSTYVLVPVVWAWLTLVYGPVGYIPEVRADTARQEDHAVAVGRVATVHLIA